jgi:tRNA A-37 threonylcarbamoyl transferase component Bud32
MTKPATTDGAAIVALATQPTSERVCAICEQRYPPDFVVCPRDGARLESPDQDRDPLVGSVLGGAFRILRSIGEGATARVYEASHVRLGKKRFAVKVLHSFYGADPTALARFQREAEAAAAISHACVVDVYDVNRTADGRFYLVTELLEGTDLGTLLQARRKLAIGPAVAIARAACRGLDAAHRLGVVHRDMKPDNVFISGDPDDPRVKLLDFGISKVDDGANLTQTGMLVGTPAYMAPEQAVGAEVDARTDVYAVGALLYRTLTGHKPFSGDETADVLSALLTREPARPRSLEPSIPEALELVVQRAMAKRPEHRYPSALELERALAPFDPSTVTTGRSAPPEAREARHARPLLATLTIAAILWVVALVDAAALSLLARGDAPARDLELGRLCAVTIAVLVVAAGPSALFVRHLRQVWPSTPRAMAMAARLRRLLVASVGSYAALAVLARVLEAAGAASGGAATDTMLALVSLAAGGIVGWIPSGERRG